MPSEIVHDIQYAASHEVNESDVGALTAQDLPKPLPKEELANHLTIEKRKIRKDGHIIGTSKRKDMNFKGM